MGKDKLEINTHLGLSPDVIILRLVSRLQIFLCTLKKQNRPLCIIDYTQSNSQTPMQVLLVWDGKL